MRLTSADSSTVCTVWQELGGMSSSLSGNGLKALMSFASTAMICSKVPGRPEAPAPNCSSVWSWSVVVDVTEFSQTVLPFEYMCVSCVSGRCSPRNTVPVTLGSLSTALQNRNQYWLHSATVIYD